MSIFEEASDSADDLVTFVETSIEHGIGLLDVEEEMGELHRQQRLGQLSVKTVYAANKNEYQKRRVADEMASLPNHFRQDGRFTLLYPPRCVIYLHISAMMSDPPR